MIQVVADQARNRLTITLGGHLAPAEVATFTLERLPVAVGHLQPGFDLITDVQDLLPTDPEDLEAMRLSQAFLMARGLGRVARVSRQPNQRAGFRNLGQKAGLRAIQVFTLEEATQVLASTQDRFGREGNSSTLRERACRRIATGPEHTVRFRVRNREFPAIRILNLSAQGCLAVLPLAEGADLGVDTALADFRLGHPDLPGRPFAARVARVVHGGTEGIASGDVGLGIQFLTHSQAFRDWIDAFVAAWSPSEQS
jgi:hypothetical protein